MATVFSFTTIAYKHNNGVDPIHVLLPKVWFNKTTKYATAKWIYMFEQVVVSFQNIARITRWAKQCFHGGAPRIHVQ